MVMSRELYLKKKQLPFALEEKKKSNDPCINSSLFNQIWSYNSYKQ